MEFREYWNNAHLKYSTGKITYDNWLDGYEEVLKECKTEVLDLGCGTGNNTLYLIERGFKVISSDYSEVALNKVAREIKGTHTLLMDISKTFPFPNEKFDVVIADLSLHYFDKKTTIAIMQEIKRVLTKNGTLIARVNSVKDVNYGAHQGEKIEENYYLVGGYKKRFFTIQDSHKYFSYVGEVTAKETTMARYSKPKMVIEVMAKK